MENTDKELYVKEKVIINGKRLTAVESTVLLELINGADYFGVQYESFLEDASGIDKDQQKEIVSNLLGLFKGDMSPKGDLLESDFSELVHYEMNGRTLNRLNLQKYGGIFEEMSTIKTLMNMNEEELMSIRGLGRGGLNNTKSSIQNFCHHYGIDYTDYALFSD